MVRSMKIAVISDVHLGTYGCHAQELLNYLQSIEPEILVINGDFIDGWQFKRNYFPFHHIQVIYEIMYKAMHGTKVYYVAGNHDEFIRKFTPFFSGNLYLRDQLELDLDGQRHLFFHGDVFDFSVQLSPWLAKLGGVGYDHLIRVNTLVNRLRLRLGMQRISFAHMVKRKIKKAIRFIKSFENAAIAFGANRKVDVVVCGHIHIPAIQQVTCDGRQLTYMNSGDWIENLTALEYQDNCWKLYTYDQLEYRFLNRKLMVKEPPLKNFEEKLIQHSY